MENILVIFVQLNYQVEAMNRTCCFWIVCIRLIFIQERVHYFVKDLIELIFLLVLVPEQSVVECVSKPFSSVASYKKLAKYHVGIRERLTVVL